ncbi:Glycosyl transferases group 1 [Bremerella volcania]|uniref:Glycosyl transferases group 1 n=1 Tax=Bremerella volcania TaxID=2527984 RepID=A0A518C5P9_9BACT|nr:glycosyltransferase family 4 protein [Bremerella volcania]QDU74553.1 Glycosyl transferases group 1 [Bremerella volcania]
MADTSLRIGMVSTRLTGTDGVSLESEKWTRVLQDLGHECFFFAGQSDRSAERSRVVPEAHFEFPAVREINADLFENYSRSATTSEAIHELWRILLRALREFIDDFGIQLLIVENALSLPMNVPLAVALTEIIAETNIATVAHHHDFAWERERYAVNTAEDYLRASFPPDMPTIRHVVINSFGASQLALRTGIRATLIPNVMDFDSPPSVPDEFCDDLRATLGLGSEEVMLLQPTRVVPRKRIERAIELARWLDRPCSLVISHESGDEGSDYKEYLEDYANVLGVRVLFADEHFATQRGSLPGGQKIYALADAYHHADLVTYPSRVEGFGNAFLETIYYRRPLVISRYEIFKTDIRPKGFEVIGFDSYIDRHTVQSTCDVLDNSDESERIVEHNFALGRKYYSFSVLKQRLCALIGECREQLM